MDRTCKVQIALITLFLAGFQGVAWAKDRARGNKIPFDVAKLRIEVNETDGDSGLHILLDGEGWRSVELSDPRGRTVLKVRGFAGVGRTGLTEMFFESAEPGFDELPLNDFLARFPQGVYKFTGTTVEGERIAGQASLSHAIPAAPQLISPESGSTQVINNTVIAWSPVADPLGSTIVKYEVIVENDNAGLSLSATVPATVNQITVPAEFLTAGTEYKYEVLAIEAGGNQTLAEATFSTAP